MICCGSVEILKWMKSTIWKLDSYVDNCVCLKYNIIRRKKFTNF